LLDSCAKPGSPGSPELKTSSAGAKVCEPNNGASVTAGAAAVIALSRPVVASDTFEISCDAVAVESPAAGAGGDGAAAVLSTLVGAAWESADWELVEPVGAIELVTARSGDMVEPEFERCFLCFFASHQFVVVAQGVVVKVTTVVVLVVEVCVFVVTVVVVVVLVVFVFVVVVLVLVVLVDVVVVTVVCVVVVSVSV